jgi:5-methylcytosine-specific restriction enzyme subunit McrC
MSVLTVFEHEYTEGFDWTERDCAALERLRRATGVEILRPTVRAGRRELQAAEQVGVVRLGARTIQILPKIHRAASGATERERAAEATRNLLHMLAHAGQLPVREHQLAPLLRRGADWFEILTRLFAAHLLEAWQRGAHRHYRTAEEELPVLKGKWLIAEQLRRPARRHTFAVAHDEFTADNQLNRVLRFVVERLWQLTRDGGNRQLLGELRQWMEEVTLSMRITAADAAPSLLTRLNRHYEPLLALARLFLEGGSLQLAAQDFNTFAFVFDMNRLFESFLVNFIRRRADILPPALAACEALPQTRGATLYLARDERGRAAFQLKPDLALRRGDSFPLLLDAKYKRLKPQDARLGVSTADFYQMHAYARRYECPRVLLLYPQTADMTTPLRAHFTVEGGAHIIEAATVNLQHPLDEREGRAALARELRQLLQEIS